MKLYAPKYYKNFKCIADQCTHSCCIGWEIDIDDGTYEKYSRLSGGYGETVKDSISTDGTPHFKLGKGDRCPHLNECGLCEIILNIGEDKYFERFLAYLIYRHCTEAFDLEDFCDRLEFCLFCVKLFSSIVVSENARTLDEIAYLASIVSEEIEYCDENTFALMQ